MRRAACAAVGLLLTALGACTTPLPRKQVEVESIGTVKDVPKPVEDDSPGPTTSPNSATANVAKEAACTMTDVENLEDALRSCDVPMPKQSDLPQLAGKLEVSVSAATPSTTPGGRVDLLLTLRNKNDGPLPLYFTGDPSPRFDVEAYDAKGRARVDIPPGKWPGYPKGWKPEARDTKASRITLEKNGTARMKIAWDAVKSKWAPDKAKTWEGRGYPRTPAGPMPPGKYSLRVVVPLISEVDAPKVDIEVTK